MVSSRSHGSWILVLFFLLALVLQIMPWPREIVMFRPNWLALFLIYWVMALPYRVNVITGFVLGFVWDIVLGTPLGVHALALSLLAYLVEFKFKLLRNMPLWQQAFVIVLLTTGVDIIVFLGQLLSNDAVFQLSALWNSMVNGILWPWFFLLMRKLRRQFGIQ